MGSLGRKAIKATFKYILYIKDGNGGICWIYFGESLEDRNRRKG